MVERERDQIIESRKQFANRCSELEVLMNDGHTLGHGPLPVSQTRGNSVEPGSSVSVAAGGLGPDAEAYFIFLSYFYENIILTKCFKVQIHFQFSNKILKLSQE